MPDDGEAQQALSGELEAALVRTRLLKCRLECPLAPCLRLNPPRELRLCCTFVPGPAEETC